MNHFYSQGFYSQTQSSRSALKPNPGPPIQAAPVPMPSSVKPSVQQQSPRFVAQPPPPPPCLNQPPRRQPPMHHPLQQQPSPTQNYFNFNADFDQNNNNHQSPTSNSPYQQQFRNCHPYSQSTPDRSNSNSFNEFKRLRKGLLHLLSM